jgi:hypothetical protein
MYEFLSFPEKRKAFSRFSAMSLPTIPEEEPRVMPTHPKRTWKTIFCCFGSSEETTPVVEEVGLGIRRTVATVDLAALGTSA